MGYKLRFLDARVATLPSYYTTIGKSNIPNKISQKTQDKSDLCKDLCIACNPKKS